MKHRTHDELCSALAEVDDKETRLQRLGRIGERFLHLASGKVCALQKRSALGLTFDWVHHGGHSRATIVFYGPSGCTGRPHVLVAAMTGCYRRGFDVVAVRHRSPPPSQRERLTRELRLAIQWLSDRLAEKGVSPGNIYIAGHGEGAWLAKACADMPEVAGGMFISGYCDRGSAFAHAEELRQTAPLPSMAGPVVFAYGSKEPTSLQAEVKARFERWIASGLAGSLMVLKDRDHIGMLNELASPWGHLTQAFITLIDNYEMPGDTEPI